MATELPNDDAHEQGPSVHFRVTLPDLFAFSEYMWLEKRGRRPGGLLAWVVLALVISYWLIYCAARGVPPLELWDDPLSVLLFVVLVLVALLFLLWLFLSHAFRVSARRRFQDREKQGLNEMTVLLSDEGFTVMISEEMKHLESWAELERIIHTKDHIFLAYPGNRSMVIPRSGFVSDSDFDTFWQAASGYLARASRHSNHPV